MPYPSMNLPMQLPLFPPPNYSIPPPNMSCPPPSLMNRFPPLSRPVPSSIDVLQYLFPSKTSKNEQMMNIGIENRKRCNNNNIENTQPKRRQFTRWADEPSTPVVPICTLNDMTWPPPEFDRPPPLIPNNITHRPFLPLTNINVIPQLDTVEEEALPVYPEREPKETLPKREFPTCLEEMSDQEVEQTQMDYKFCQKLIKECAKCMERDVRESMIGDISSEKELVVGLSGIPYQIIGARGKPLSIRRWRQLPVYWKFLTFLVETGTIPLKILENALLKKDVKSAIALISPSIRKILMRLNNNMKTPLYSGLCMNSHSVLSNPQTPEGQRVRQAMRILENVANDVWSKENDKVAAQMALLPCFSFESASRNEAVEEGECDDDSGDESDSEIHLASEISHDEMLIPEGSMAEAALRSGRRFDIESLFYSDFSSCQDY